MAEEVQRLVDLSRLDTDLAERQAEKAALPAKRERCQETWSECEARLEAARLAVQEAEQGQRRSEAELTDKEALLTKLTNQQHQVKTNEAYTALLHEMDDARTGISDAETLILEAMEAIETARATLAEVEADAKKTRGRLDAEEKGLDEREQALDAQLADLTEKRRATSEAIDGKLMARYEKIAARRSPAVAIVSGETCQGCRVGIPPQSYIEILRGEELISCPHCHRMLIHEDQLVAPAAC